VIPLPKHRSPSVTAKLLALVVALLGAGALLLGGGTAALVESAAESPIEETSVAEEATPGRSVRARRRVRAIVAGAGRRLVAHRRGRSDGPSVPTAQLLVSTAPRRGPPQLDR
jgi:hypothetical protein